MQSPYATAIIIAFGRVFFLKPSFRMLIQMAKVRWRVITPHHLSSSPLTTFLSPLFTTSHHLSSSRLVTPSSPLHTLSSPLIISLHHLSAPLVSYRGPSPPPHTAPQGFQEPPGAPPPSGRIPFPARGRRGAGGGHQPLYQKRPSLYQKRPSLYQKRPPLIPKSHRGPPISLWQRSARAEW